MDTTTITTIDVMTDVHTHILPGMDDGASSAQEARQMLARAAEQGTTLLCLTPHYYHYEEPPETFCERRELAFREITGCAAELGLTLLLGSETYLTPDLLNERTLNGLCIGQSRYLLLEAPLASSFSDKTMRLIECVMCNFNVTPILAHIERYTALLEQREKLLALLDMGCLTQINLSSLQGDFFLRRRLFKYLSEGIIHFVGTDCHDLAARPPDYGGLTLLRKRFGDAFVDVFQKKAKERLDIP